MLPQNGKNLITRHDIAELLNHILQRRAVFFIRKRCIAVLDHYDIVVELHGIPAGTFATDIGFGTADQNRLDTLARQQALQHRRARGQCGISVLANLQVTVLNVQLVPDLLAGTPGTTGSG